MRLLKILLSLLLSLNLVTAQVFAFKSFTFVGGAVHDQITNEALEKAGFSAKSLNTIDYANVSTDTPGGTLFTDPIPHCCDDKLNEGHDYVKKRFEEIEKHIAQAGKNQTDLDLVLQNFGLLLHTVQDFYAHSNYVELALDKNAKLLPDSVQLVDWDSLSPSLMSGYFYYKSPSDYEDQYKDRDEVVKLMQPSVSRRIRVGKELDTLTTFKDRIKFFRDPKVAVLHRDLHKDNAEALEGRVMAPGNPSSSLFSYARNLAVRETTRQWQELENLVRTKCGKDADLVIKALKEDVVAPTVKLSAGKTELNAHEQTNVTAIVEPDPKDQEPLSYSWAGNHAGSGKEVTFVATSGGKFTLAVEVSGKKGTIGSASLEFNVKETAGEMVPTGESAIYGQTKKISFKLPEGVSLGTASGTPSISAGEAAKQFPGLTPKLKEWVEKGLAGKLEEIPGHYIPPSEFMKHHICPVDEEYCPVCAYYKFLTTKPEKPKVGKTLKKVIWHADPAVTFKEGTTTTPDNFVTFDRMNKVKIWAQLEITDGDRTIHSETDQTETNVVAPPFRIDFNPPTGGKPGQEITATVHETPNVSDQIISFKWNSPPSSNRLETTNNARSIKFKLKDKASYDLLVQPVVPYYGDLIDGAIKASYQGGQYKVTAVVEELGPKPRVWDPVKGGLLEIPKGTFAVFERIFLKASIEGDPKPEDIRWSWTVNEGTTISNDISSTPTVTRSATGSMIAEVTAKDKEGVLLGRAKVLVAVIVPQDRIVMDKPLKVTVSADKRRVKSGETVVISAKAEGGKEPYTYSWSGKTGSTVAVLRVVAGQAGQQQFTVTVHDAKVQEATGNIQIAIDPVELLIGLCADKTNVSFGDTAVVTATVTRGTAPYTYSWKGHSAGQGEKVSYTGATLGHHEVGLDVVDKFGNKGHATLSLEVSSPVLTLEVQPPTVPVGECTTVKLTLKPAVPLSAFNFQWSAPDSTGRQTAPDTMVITPIKSGPMAVSVKVRDDRTQIPIGEATTTITATGYQLSAEAPSAKGTRPQVWDAVGRKLVPLPPGCFAEGETVSCRVQLTEGKMPAGGRFSWNAGNGTISGISVATDTADVLLTSTQPCLLTIKLESAKGQALAVSNLTIKPSYSRSDIANALKEAAKEKERAEREKNRQKAQTLIVEAKGAESKRLFGQAISLTETAIKLDPDNQAWRDYLATLKTKSQQETVTSAATPTIPPVTYAVANVGGVQNKPSVAFIFNVQKRSWLKRLETYHWNYGQGRTPGQIGIRNTATNASKLWSASGMPGQNNVPNAYWYAKPADYILDPGQYELVDSDVATWSSNAQSGNIGFGKVELVPAETQKTPSTAEIKYVSSFAGTWDSNWGRMVITVSGTKIHAEYTHDKGRIDAELSSDSKTLNGLWLEAPTYALGNDGGRVTLTMSPDGRSLSGTWGYGNAINSGNWTGTRVGAPPATSSSPSTTKISTPATTTIQNTQKTTTTNFGLPDRIDALMENHDSMPVHLYSIGEGCSPYNKVEPGKARVVRGLGKRGGHASSLEVTNADCVNFYAGRNGRDLFRLEWRGVPAVPNGGYVRVIWNGRNLTLIPGTSTQLPPGAGQF